MRTAYNILVGKLERVYSEDHGINGRIILEWILRNRVRGCGLDASGSG
jgi:hypothetical protein